MSNYVDSLISSIPASLPSYVRDTTDFVSGIIDLIIPQGSFLVTLDVASLYTNIPHVDGIAAVARSYEAASPGKFIDSNTLAVLLRLILELNNFQFEGQHYVQVSGTSMGTRIGPNYANIFMGQLESEFLQTRALKPFYYKRYIDDIFLIWPHSEQELLSFISDFNDAHPSISFSHTYSTSTLSFLDVSISIVNDKLSTALYRKPTDRQQYLHFDSSHVKHCKTSIPYSQALRFKRICSEQSEFQKNCRTLKDALVKQKYPPQLIDDAIKRADMHNRRTLLCAAKNSTPSPQTNLVLTHSASVPRVSNVLRKHHNILMQSERLRNIFTEPPKAVYRKAKTIRDILSSSSSSKANSPDTIGCHPCQKPRCKVCPYMRTCQQVTSTGSNFSLKIKGNLDCDSKNVIYMIECALCEIQYIGQTEGPFRLRFNNHKSHANTLPHLPISRHVHLPDHSFENLQVTLLESGFRTNYDREARESFLIYKFNAVASGLNENVGKLSCLSA